MWGTCYNGSNNIHFNFPPIMADGRNYSSWQPDAVVNNNIRNYKNIKSNWEYRRFLTDNALNIMKYNKTEACDELGLPTHIDTNNTPSSNVQQMYSTVMDTSNPGFGYRTTNLKSPYLTREQLEARMNQPQPKK
jgi:hypothetical protein